MYTVYHATISVPEWMAQWPSYHSNQIAGQRSKDYIYTLVVLMSSFILHVGTIQPYYTIVLNV